MSKILVVPDVHGRDFWIEPCQKWQGPIVFLGDYHDPYPFQVSKEKSLEILKQLVEFYENNKDRITCLIGNHDGNYLIKSGFADRVDSYHYAEVESLLRKLDLKTAYLNNDLLFSHAGALKEWLEINNLSIEEVPDLDFKNKALADVSPYRGGSAQVGGILWGDVQEYDERPHVPEIYQVFGHTQLMKDPIIQKDYACLDCRQCFIIDTETKEIIPYNE